MRSVMARRG